MTPRKQPKIPGPDVAVAHLLRLAANEEPRLDAYLAALCDAGWEKKQLAEKLGVTRQRVSQRVHRVRESTTVYDLTDLPVTYPPAKPERDYSVTMSGLRIPNALAIDEEAAAEVQSELGGIEDEWERLIRSAAIAAEADDAGYKKLLAERTKLALSLFCYERATGLAEAGAFHNRREYFTARREALDVDSATLNRMSDEDLAALAKSKRIWRYRDAPERLHTVACEIVRRRARARAARPIRDDLIPQFKGQVYSADLGATITRNQSRVRQIWSGTPRTRTNKAGA